MRVDNEGSCCSRKNTRGLENIFVLTGRNSSQDCSLPFLGHFVFPCLYHRCIERHNKSARPRTQSRTFYAKIFQFQQAAWMDVVKSSFLYHTLINEQNPVSDIFSPKEMSSCISLWIQMMLISFKSLPLREDFLNTPNYRFPFKRGGLSVLKLLVPPLLETVVGFLKKSSALNRTISSLSSSFDATLISLRISAINSSRELKFFSPRM